MDKWIAVKITDGLFSSERTVHFGTVDGEIAVFVSLNQLDEASRVLRIQLLDQDDEYCSRPSSVSGWNDRCEG